MKIKYALLPISICLFFITSCQPFHLSNRSVKQYFEDWEGVWEIDKITYIDKDTSFHFGAFKAQIEFFACPEVIRNEGGMCTIEVTDEKGNINELFAVGSYANKDDKLGNLRFDYSSNTQFSTAFNDSLLVIGEFVVKEFTDEKATLEGGRIANFNGDDPFFSEDVTIDLIRK